jgi:hypothetical protein
MRVKMSQCLKDAERVAIRHGVWGKVRRLFAGLKVAWTRKFGIECCRTQTRGCVGSRGLGRQSCTIRSGLGILQTDRSAARVPVRIEREFPPVARPKKRRHVEGHERLLVV